MLAGDAIMNYRTVLSFGEEEKIVQLYQSLLMTGVSTSVGNLHKTGFALGFSQFMQNVVFAFLFWAGMKILINSNGDIDPQDLFIAIFAMMFGA